MASNTAKFSWGLGSSPDELARGSSRRGNEDEPEFKHRTIVCSATAPRRSEKEPLSLSLSLSLSLQELEAGLGKNRVFRDGAWPNLQPESSPPPIILGGPCRDPDSIGDGVLVPAEEHVGAAIQDVGARLLLLRHLEAALLEARRRPPGRRLLPPRPLFLRREDVLIDHSSSSSSSSSPLLLPSSLLRTRYEDLVTT
ncbi:hypothetical protein NL676_033310 [Syzygium grande]|nr:hypothetical protein NL676_033310 [Syzygium grande]